MTTSNTQSNRSVVGDAKYNVKGTPFGGYCYDFGLRAKEILALDEHFPMPGRNMINSNRLMIEGSTFAVITLLTELIYSVVCSAEKVDTLDDEKGSVHLQLYAY